MGNNSSSSVNHRAFLKEADLSLNSTLILSHPMIRVLHRIRGNVRLVQTVGPFSPSSGSFENEMPDLTLDSYMDKIPYGKRRFYAGKKDVTKNK